AYSKPTLCSVGRGPDCVLRVPNNVLTTTVSRHHCLLEIDPPVVRVCDLGSRNGTFVNGLSIGRRLPGRPADDLHVSYTPDHPFHDGDVLRVGEVTFRVGVQAD